MLHLDHTPEQVEIEAKRSEQTQLFNETLKTIHSVKQGNNRVKQVVRATLRIPIVSTFGRSEYTDYVSLDTSGRDIAPTPKYDTTKR